MAETVEEKLKRYEAVIGLQMEEIDRLRAVVAKLTGPDNDAHSTLRRLYLDETQNPNSRIRAAQAALGVEKPSLKPQPAPLELAAEPVIPLADLVRRRRARADAIQGLPPDHPKVLAWVDRDHTDEPPDYSGQGDGNGGNSGSNHS